ncbi:DUF1835 domain-containing protein [Telluribacter sp. SYSU D00476]|uniref:DUF1835 domain-containing protein n=1 Tax=Telluribacter sp. SYSU D00476 TaxID=2811430 RepID=UPI001FF661C3|nr:DUF1835 domain-containing protein [Telluribacter sp. SYSU D00476]
MKTLSPTSAPSSYHILNGDALLDKFPHAAVPGECIVARECLVVGDVSGASLEEFWESRARFISQTYGESSEGYYQRVVGEFEKMQALPAGSEVNLWFEEDLYCQVNLWFCLSLLRVKASQLNLYIVKPHTLNGQPDWRGFGPMTTEDLAAAYREREVISQHDVELLSQCWQAYKEDNRERLRELSTVHSDAFPYLQTVCEAHLDRFATGGADGRPQQVLRDIISEKQTDDFSTIYAEFFRRAGVYGFGDTQVKQLLDTL